VSDIYDKPDLVNGLLDSPSNQEGEEEEKLWMMLDTEERKRYRDFVAVCIKQISTSGSEMFCPE
jgi:hypothetical protein